VYDDRKVENISIILIILATCTANLRFRGLCTFR
jgi:hypothetical protein